MDMHFPEISADLVRDIDNCGIQLIDPDIRAGWKKMQDDSLSSDGDIDRGFRSLITPYLIGKPLPAAIGVAEAGNRSDLGC